MNAKKYIYIKIYDYQDTNKLIGHGNINRKLDSNLHTFAEFKKRE